MTDEAYPFPKPRGVTWNDIERSAAPFWRAHVTPASDDFFERVQRGAAMIEVLAGQSVPQLMVISKGMEEFAAKVGAAEIAAYLAEACRACRPIFGDIIHPVPEYKPAAGWVLGGGWPFERGPWYALD